MVVPLRHLGKQSQAPITELDLIPWKTAPILVELDCSEFTSYCPVTDQPDFATLKITYCPGEWLVETKSLKLWLQSFRDCRAFNEDIVATICETFDAQVKPLNVKVEGRFHVRGGIAVTATAERGTV